GGGQIQRAGQLRGYANGISRRRGLLIADDHVERIGGHEVHRQVRRHIGDAGRERRGNPGVRQVGGDQSLELGDQLVSALGRKIDTKNFDGNEPILFRLVGAKDRAKSTGADLVKHAKRSESVGRRSAGSVRVQRVLLEGRRSNRNIETHLVQSFRHATVPVSWLLTRSKLLCNQTPQASPRLESQSTSGASRGSGVSPPITPTIFPRWPRFSAAIPATARPGLMRSAARKPTRRVAPSSRRWWRTSRSVEARRHAPARRHDS